MTTFETVSIKPLSRKKCMGRIFALSEKGNIQINLSTHEDLGIRFNPGESQYLHFKKDNEGNYYIYVDKVSMNGIKLRPVYKLENSDARCQCTSLVDQITADLHLPLGHGRQKSVKLKISETPVNADGIQVWRLIPE